MTRSNTFTVVSAVLLLAASGTLLADGALLPPGAPVVQPTASEPALSAQGLSAAGLNVTGLNVTGLSATGSASASDPARVGELYATGETPVVSADPSEPVGYHDLWERIRAGFKMKEIDTPLVQRHEAWYLNRPEYVQRMVDRSRRYLYFIVVELEKRGMPTEIALLPMIESAYNPTAYSRMRASGIWQFIPSTGKKYGLQQTWWYDGRRDVLAATRAALDYLQVLHDTFGSWELALAAYNCGEGGIQRAVAKNRAKHKPTDYFSLKLPKETRNYLPKLQAVKNIVADPSLFALGLDEIPNLPYFAIVKAPTTIDVVMAAKLADMSVEDFRNLNPGHQRPVITPVANRELLVPVDKAELFHANLENNAQPLVTWQTYQLKQGEKLDTVANKFGISLQRLQEVNGLTAGKRTRVGQMLLVPMEEDDTTTNLDETYNSAEFKAPADDYHGRVVYRVKAGDSLASIARRYKTSPELIQQWNGLSGTTLRTGQRLTIWQEARHRHHIARR